MVVWSYYAFQVTGYVLADGWNTQLSYSQGTKQILSYSLPSSPITMSTTHGTLSTWKFTGYAVQGMR